MAEVYKDIKLREATYDKVNYIKFVRKDLKSFDDVVDMLVKEYNRTRDREAKMNKKNKNVKDKK